MEQQQPFANVGKAATVVLGTVKFGSVGPVILI